MTEKDYDYYSAEFQNDPPATYNRMMRECPVHKSEQWGWYSLFRYADIHEAITDNETYSVRKGPGPQDSEGSPTLLVSADPPEHTLQKRLVSRVFNLRYMESFEPALREYVGTLLDRIERQGRCDLIEDLAIPVPLWIICQLLEEDFDTWGASMRAWTYEMAGAVFSQDRATTSALSDAMVEMQAYIAPRVDEAMRRAAAGEPPSFGIIGELARVEIDGQRLRKDQLTSFTSFLIIAGSGTTTNSIGNFFLGMLEHPDQYALLQARPELLANAVDEVIRYYAPVPGLFRTNNVPLNIRGMDIPADSKICVMWGSGNRDPELFENPNVFDITRDLDELKKKSLSFGGGIHRCMGAPLSRMEIRVAAGEFIKRFPNFREVGQRVDYPYATLIGHDHLYLEW